MRVFVYWNLHRHCWSVKALDGQQRGRVVAHPAEVVVSEATLKVSAAGRQRVLSSGKKQVHAGVVGTWEQHRLPPTQTGRRVRYNPKETASFVDAATGEAVYRAALVVLTGQRQVLLACE